MRFDPLPGIGRVGWGIFSLVAVANAVAQPAPRIGYLYPAGARAGATALVTVGGQNLDTPTQAHFSVTGIRSEVVEVHKPMPQGQFNMLRDQLRELQERKQAALRATRQRSGKVEVNSTNTWSGADEKKLAEIRDKILKNPPNRNATPAIAETVTLRVTVPDDVPPGDYELRLRTANGLSNPMRFCVDRLPEFSEPPARAPNPDLDRFLERLGRTPPPPTAARTEMRVTLPATLNGQIMPGNVDRFRFAARQGQRLVAIARARALIPYVADAVPGWFQATLTLYDTKGNELAYTDDFRHDPDPVLYYQIPRDGEYVLEIKDAIYRGREDFVYRLTAGELPFITAIFPLGGRTGQSTGIQLAGWNLPVTNFTVDASNWLPGIYRSTPQGDGWVGNAVLFAVGTDPEIVDQEENNTLQTARPVTLPVTLNGRIQQPGDADVYQFEARGGEEIVAEVLARRLNSPLDSVLRLTDATGQRLASNDDFEDKGAGLTTHHADSYLRVRLPATGAYYLHITDAQQRGGPDYAYRLRLSRPCADFELRVVPASLALRAGASAPVTVHVLRKDGFTNEITLALRDSPPGFSLSGGRIPAGQEQVKLTVTAPWFAPDSPVALHLEGRAMVDGRELVRPAVPAEELVQAFAYRHLVPAQEWVAVVNRGFSRAGSIKLLSQTPVKIPAGGSATVRFDVPARALSGPMQLELADPPEGIRLGRVTPARDGTELILHADADTARPGQKGNLIVQVLFNRTGSAKTKAPAATRQPVATLPAIPFEVVAR